MIGISFTPRRRALKITPPGPSDGVPPMLSDLLIDQNGKMFSFVNSEAGACHWVLDNTVSFADAAALVAAKPTAAASGSLAASLGANTHTIDSSGVATGTWRLHVGVIDPAGNASNVLSGDFTIIAGALEMSVDPLVWNGDPLIFNAA